MIPSGIVAPLNQSLYSFRWISGYPIGKEVSPFDDSSKIDKKNREKHNLLSTIQTFFQP
jgi:hypothetical protein